MNIIKRIKNFFVAPEPKHHVQLLSEFNDLVEHSVFYDINLNKLATEIRERDSGEKNLSITDVKEIVAILGIRWRSMPASRFLHEVWAIYLRAGLNSNAK